MRGVGEDYLVTRIEPDECVAAIDSRLVIGSIGGLSGCPVFVWRVGLIVLAEFVGIVVEYHESLDLLYIRRANCLQDDGRLHK